MSSNLMQGLKNPDGSRNWVALLLLAIAGIVFVVIVYFTYSVIKNQYTKTSSSEPWLVETTKMSTKPMVIPAKLIPRSNDGQYGLEFSYSMWLYLDGWQDNTNQNNLTCKTADGATKCLTHILSKGDPTTTFQTPGLWLERKENNINLIVKLNTYDKKIACEGDECFTEKCSFGNMPVNKWVHVIVSVINQYVDIYINGFLKTRCVLNGLPLQNDGDVYINYFGGFNGFMSRVRYFNYALPIWKVEQIMKQGPSEYVSPDISGTVPPYLAYDWWVEKNDKNI